MTNGIRPGELFWLWIIPVGITLGGVALLLSAGGREQRETLIAASPVETMAEVISVYDDPGRYGTHAYTPTVEFTTVNGYRHEVELDLVNDGDEYVVGEEVAITFNAEHPDVVVASAHRMDYLALRAWGWVVLVLGVAVMSVAGWGTAVLVKARRK